MNSDKNNKFCSVFALLLAQLLMSITALNTQNNDNSKINPNNWDKKHTNSKGNNFIDPQNVDAAVKHGFEVVENLVRIQEPLLYKMGLFLDKQHPARKVAEFGKPNKRALKLSHFGMATLEATKKFIDDLPENVSRQINDFPISIESRILSDDCPLNGKPRCPILSKTYRTFDGTCNNLLNPWKGASMLPMQRLLPPTYEDGLQSVRRSVLGTRLPSAREISSKIHRDKNHETNVVTLMFMQWGQFIDHDVTSVVKSRGFNGSIPRCCETNGEKVLPQKFMHPSCLPIEIPENDWFFSKFNIGCMEFLRSAPSTRINCDLGWREQINQVTSFIDASMIYGNDIETADSIRTFRHGKILYGRSHVDRPLHPPDPPGGELCSAGALSTDCFETGDGRVMEQPGLTALHTVWIRYHNKVATILSRFNSHWSDEKVYQETRKIVYSLIQHITYKEFIPVLLGQEVTRLFELNLTNKGYYMNYNPKVNPTIANAFSTAAYRFGHSMVQNSFIRTDGKHRPIFNNVSLHDEFKNFENIWSFGSVDRTLLGFCNQLSQRRDEFICEELSNHLFQSTDMPFGMDLAAINIQRGRDHGIPSYTSWREPCGLTPVQTWDDLNKIFSMETAKKFRNVYRHVEDIDLFSGGLAEKPVKGAVVGPTFACIIAQQFVNLRKGDRFWYENGDFPSSFTPAQLQQIRRATFSNILCQTMDEIETIQPFVFLAPDDGKNKRLSCPLLKNFDLVPWIESDPNELDSRLFSREGSYTLSEKRRNTILKNRKKTKPIPTSTTSHTVIKNNKDTVYNRKTTERPIQINIKIEYYPPNNPTVQTNFNRDTTIPPDRQPSSSNHYDEQPVSYPVFFQSPSITSTYNQPSFTETRPTFTIGSSSNFNQDEGYGSYNYRPPQMYNKPTAENYNKPVKYRPSDDYDEVVFEDKPFITSNKPEVYKPIKNHFLYNDVYVDKGHNQNSYNKDIYQNNYDKEVGTPVKVYSTGYVQKIDANDISDKLDFKSSLVDKNKKFVKISSVKAEATIASSSVIINTALQREGDVEITEENDNKVRLVDVDVAPSENDNKNWLIYDETEKTMLTLDMPSVSSQTESTEDLPQPIKKWRNFEE